MIQHFFKWMNTPATITKQTGVNNNGEPIYATPINTSVYIFPLSSEELSTLQIKTRSSHQVYFREQIDMVDRLEVTGISNKTPAKIEYFYNEKGAFDHTRVIL